MYSTTSEDLSRDHLAIQVANCLKKIVESHQTVTQLHKELVEIDLSFTAYIEESNNRLQTQRLNLARQAKSSQEVVDILSEKSTPRKQSNLSKTFNIQTYKEDNNNSTNKFTERQQARTFITWYKHMIDHDRQNIGLYLSDDAVLEWFGRTIKTRKKVQSFLRFDMQCSQHDFTTIESIDKVQLRHERIVKRKEDTVLTSPPHSPELLSSKSSAKKRLLRSNCNSPEWAEGCQPEEDKSIDRKRLKSRHIETQHEHKSLKRKHPDDTIISSKGDGIAEKRPKQKCPAVTPPNHELGQGDCLPSTSGNTASHEALNSQLPKLAVECTGYIEFTRTRNNRTTDSMKWERKCKVQISYSVDPLNVGEYIIWSLHYFDESKCRRNLMAAFEAVAKEEESNKIK